MAGTSGSTETRLQSFIHAIEQGRFALVLRGFIFAVVIIAIALVYLGWRFRGFASPDAMDQAQVAREISRGHGWSTEMIRPLALWQLTENKLPLPKEQFPDTYNAPLPPLVNSVAIKLAGDKVKFAEHEYILPAERLIVALSMICFLASIGVQYLLLRRLFDTRLAFWASSATLVCDLCWQFTLSGLPQMLMLLLFNAALYALVRALQIHRALEAGANPGTVPTVPSPREGKAPEVARSGKVLIWMGLAGVLFGLLALSHAITIWLFIGALAYSAVHFRRRGPVVLILLLAFALVYAPWLVRNYRVSGSALGLSGYQIYDGLSATTFQRMRNLTDPMTDAVHPYFFRPKVQHGVREQLANIAGSLGSNWIALAFFLGLVHVFRRSEVNSFRWAILLMWVLAILGMGIAGPGDTESSPVIGPNQIGGAFPAGHARLRPGVRADALQPPRDGLGHRCPARVLHSTVSRLRAPADLLPFAEQRFAFPVPTVFSARDQPSRLLDQRPRNHRVRHAVGRGVVRRPQKPVDSQQAARLDGSQR